MEFNGGEVGSVASTVLALSRSSITRHHDYFYIFEHSHTSNTATSLACPILFFFFSFLSAPHSMWDLSSPTRDGTPAPARGAWSLSPRTESPCKPFPCVCVCLFGFCCLCHVTSGILAPDQELNPGSLPWKPCVLTTGPSGNSLQFLILISRLIELWFLPV